MTGRSASAAIVSSHSICSARDGAGGLHAGCTVSSSAMATPGQLDPLVAGVAGLALVGVVVAAHDVQAVAEAAAVAGLERRPFLGLPVLRQVALHDDGDRVERRRSRATAAGSSSPGTAARPGAARWIGPSGLSPIRPASVSPKCTSFTVAKRHSSSPAGRGERGDARRRGRCRWCSGWRSLVTRRR